MVFIKCQTCYTTTASTALKSWISPLRGRRVKAKFSAEEEKPYNLSSASLTVDTIADFTPDFPTCAKFSYKTLLCTLESASGFVWHSGFCNYPIEVTSWNSTLQNLGNHLQTHSSKIPWHHLYSCSLKQSHPFLFTFVYICIFFFSC